MTDEDAFILVNARDGVSIKVGPGETHATYRAAGTGEFLAWLRQLPAKLGGRLTLQSLDLGLIGNCSISALIDREARMVWCCLPRFDGDPIFHALLGHSAAAPDDGVFSIEIENQSGTVQSLHPQYRDA